MVRATTLTAAYIAIMTCAVLSAGMTTREARRRFPILTLSVCLVLWICLAAQMVNPGLLNDMQRDAGRIRDGEWHRLVTALFFQDGGIAGGIWNITVLAMVGTLAEQMLDRGGWAAAYLVSGISAELVALSWQPVGAGNSVAVFGLAGAVVATAWQRTGHPAASMLALFSGVVAALLACVHDIHGAAFAVGAVGAIVTIW